MDTDDRAGASLDEAKSGTHHVPDITKFTTDLVGLRNEFHAQECCQCVGVDLVGLHLGVADGFDILGMSEYKFDAV